MANLRRFEEISNERIARQEKYLEEINPTIRPAAVSDICFKNTGNSKYENS